MSVICTYPQVRSSAPLGNTVAGGMVTVDSIDLTVVPGMLVVEAVTAEAAAIDVNAETGGETESDGFATSRCCSEPPPHATRPAATKAVAAARSNDDIPLRQDSEPLSSAEARRLRHLPFRLPESASALESRYSPPALGCFAPQMRSAPTFAARSSVTTDRSRLRREAPTCPDVCLAPCCSSCALRVRHR